MDIHAVRLDTLVTRTDRAPGSLPDIAPALHQTATFRAADDATFLEMATTPRHDAYYTRDGNPTISDVESLIAALEGAESCLLTASGMGAMSTAVLGLVRQGDRVVAQRTHYMGTTQLLGEVLPRFGVEVSVVDQADSRAIEEAVTPKTRLVVVETPANPLLTLTDLAHVAELGRRHGVLTLCDNTIGTPINQQPIGLGIDGRAQCDQIPRRPSRSHGRCDRRDTCAGGPDLAQPRRLGCSGRPIRWLATDARTENSSAARPAAKSDRSVPCQAPF